MVSASASGASGTGARTRGVITAWVTPLGARPASNGTKTKSPPSWPALLRLAYCGVRSVLSTTGRLMASNTAWPSDGRVISRKVSSSARANTELEPSIGCGTGFTDPEVNAVRERRSAMRAIQAS